MKTSNIFRFFIVAAAICVASCNKFEDPYTTKGKTPLADPANITVDADYKQATISWDAVTGAAQYYYEVRNASNFIYVKGFTTTPSLYLSGLIQLSDYSVALKAIPSPDDAGKTAGSNVVTKTFKTADASEYIWEKKGIVKVDGVDTGRTATLQYEYESGLYTIMGWYGYSGKNITFTVDEEAETWLWDTDLSNCFYWADEPNSAYCFYDGGNGAGFTWLYTNATYFKGDKDGGVMNCWGWIENASWSEWSFEW